MKGWNTTIGNTTIVEIFVRELYCGFWTNNQCRSWINAITLEVYVVSETTGVFVKTVNPEGDFVAEWLIEIPREALVSERAALKRDFAQGSEPGLFRYAINDSTAAAATKQHRVWSFQSFDALDVVEVAIVLNVVTHTIDEEVGARAVAANDELITIVLALVRCDAGYVSDDFRQARHRLVANLFLRLD